MRKIKLLFQQFLYYNSFKKNNDYLKFKAEYFKSAMICFPIVFCLVSLSWLIKDLFVISNDFQTVLGMCLLRGVPIILLPIAFIFSKKKIESLWGFSLVMVWVAIFGVMYARYTIPTTNGHTGDGWIAYYFAMFIVSLFATAQYPIILSYLGFTVLLILTDAATWQYGFIKYMVPLSRPLASALMISFCFLFLSPAIRIMFVLFYNTKRKLENTSKRDFLCNCWNRQYVEEALKDGAFTFDATVLLIEIDGLRKINETKGNFEGDEALRKSVVLFKSILREDDLVIRYAGNKFLLVFKGSIDELTVYQRILENKQKYQINLTYSIAGGKCKANENFKDTRNKLFEALLKVRENGGNQILVI